MDLYQELKDLTRALESAGIDYALCGGVALAVHGVPRATQDIDLLIRPEDVDRLRPVARACGFTLESFPMEFGSGITIQRLAKIIDGQPLMLDLLFVSEPIEKVWAGRQAAEWEGGTIRVVSRAGLIALKLSAGRPQDIADIKRLEEAGRG